MRAKSNINQAGVTYTKDHPQVSYQDIVPQSQEEGEPTRILYTGVDSLFFTPSINEVKSCHKTLDLFWFCLNLRKHKQWHKHRQIWPFTNIKFKTGWEAAQIITVCSWNGCLCPGPCRITKDPDTDFSLGNLADFSNYFTWSSRRYYLFFEILLFLCP